jgi:hypothetical protein
MFRQLLEEAFEEFKQTVAPARPEISIPKPPGSFKRLPDPDEAPEFFPHRASPAEAAPVRPAPAAPPPRPQNVRRPSGVRAQLSSRSSLRSAFQLMEVLGPPVSLHEPSTGERKD